MSKENTLGALYLIASLHAVNEVTESNGYYIIEFEGTAATLVIDMKEVTEEELRQTIADARS